MLISPSINMKENLQEEDKMKKAFLVLFMLLLSISLFGCTTNGDQGNNDDNIQVKDNDQNKSDNSDQNQTTSQQTQQDADAVRSFVEDFGSKLQLVSLLASKEVVKKSMLDNYSEVVTQSLIEKWADDLENAPGRLTSSPWPDRIEVKSVDPVSDNEYNVNGEIIEITSTEKDSGGIAAKRSISLVVKKMNDRWLITDVTLGAYDEINSSDASNENNSIK